MSLGLVLTVAIVALYLLWSIYSKKFMAALNTRQDQPSSLDDIVPQLQRIEGSLARIERALESGENKKAS